MEEVEAKLLQVVNENGVKTPDLRTFLHQIYKDRKLEVKFNSLYKVHPWFKHFSIIYRFSKQSKSILDFVQYIEEDDDFPTDNKQMFIHWLCTNFPSAFPLVWSIDKTDDIFIETFDHQSIKIPKTINIKSLCDAFRAVACGSVSRSIFTEELTFELEYLNDHHWKFFCLHNFTGDKLLITVNKKSLIDFLDSAPIIAI